MSVILGIDIGASSMKYGWGDRHDLHHFDSLPIPIKSLECFTQVANDVLAAADKAVGLKNITAIGIGSPGTIERSTGLISGINPNLPFWTGHNPAEFIPKDLKLPVFCDNDANLMALAEASRCGSNYALGITVGSGIGGGIIFNGAIYHGAHGFAGEFGHVCMAEDGFLCNCGRKGCLEAYASVDSIRRHLAAESGELGAMELTALLSLNDSRVIRHLKLGRSMLATAIVNTVTMLDLDYVIVGGGAMEANMYDITKLKEEVNSALPVANRGKVRIIKASHGNKAGVIGAIFLAEQGI